MVKIDFTRDYYADLEVSPDASVDDVKKQFRKLALKFHPDRNPGKEIECIPRFQAIQAAHEVLGDPDQRAKYNAGRRRPAMGEGSPRPTPPPRGNPYQARSDFPPPKMRTRENGGAERYTNFAPPPRRDKPPPAQDPRERTNAFNAWQHMQNTQKAQSARQQASTQSSGYQSTRPRPPPPDPPSQGSGPGRAQPSSNDTPPASAYEESRRPRGGMDRSKSTRTRPRQGFDPAEASGDEGPASSYTYYNRPQRRSPPPPPPSQMPDSYPGHPPGPRPPPPPPPGQAPTARKPPPPQLNTFHGAMDPPFVEASRVRTPYTTHNEEKTFFSTDSLRNYGNTSKLRQDRPTQNGYQSQPPRRHSASPPHKMPANASAESNRSATKPDQPSVEPDLSDSSDDDIRPPNSRPKAQPSASWVKSRMSAPPLAKSKSFENARRSQPSIFTFPITPETFTPTSGLSRSSTNVDTNFSSGEGPIPFSSNATPGPEASDSGGYPEYFPMRGRDTSRTQQSTPNVEPTPSETLGSQPGANRPSHSPNVPFSADHWKEQLLDDNWASKWAQGPPQGTRHSPTRNSTSARKARGGGIRASSSETSSGTPLKATTPQPASIAEEETGDPRMFTGRSPIDAEDDAMDIDTTPPINYSTRPTTTHSPNPQQQPPLPRQVFVSPPNADLHEQSFGQQRRASYQNNIPPPPPNPPPPSGIRKPSLSMNDFRHVPPFQAGLAAMDDLSQNLPAVPQPYPESSEKATFRAPLGVPKLAPRAPACPEKCDKAAWTLYVDQMRQYLVNWNMFNKQMVGFFQDRATQPFDATKGPTGGILDEGVHAAGEPPGAGGWERYCREQEELRKVRTYWQVACERHQDAVEAHSKVRERVYRGGVQ